TSTRWGGTVSSALLLAWSRSPALVVVRGHAERLGPAVDLARRLRELLLSHLSQAGRLSAELLLPRRGVGQGDQVAGALVQLVVVVLVRVPVGSVFPLAEHAVLVVVRHVIVVVSMDPGWMDVGALRALTLRALHHLGTLPCHRISSSASRSLWMCSTSCPDLPASELGTRLP